MILGKIAVLMGALTFVFSAHAEDEKVEITSFNYAGSRTRAAEVCGKVTNVKAYPVFVKIVVDEEGKSPGIYNTLVGSESSFCTTVVTYRGTATAYLWNQSKEIGSSSSIKGEADVR